MTKGVVKKEFRINGCLGLTAGIGILAGYGLTEKAEAGDVIVPGGGNQATNTRSSVVSGQDNTASGEYSFIGGGRNHSASGYSSNIGGGRNHTASGYYSGIVTGYGNTASGAGSIVGSGRLNIASGHRSGVFTGDNNEASGLQSAVLTGLDNLALGDNSVVLGGEASTAAGTNSLVSGTNVTMLADHSFLLGHDIYYASTFDTGVVYLADNSRFGATKFENTQSNQMTCRFANGFLFYTHPGANTGAQLQGGATSWSSLSSRETKHEFKDVDTVEVLKKVAALPMLRWTYKHDDAHTPYMGVMAEDLYDAFELGHDNRTINTLVADGIQMAAIQGLNQLLEEKDVEIGALKKEKDAEIGALKDEQKALNQRLEKLEALLSEKLD